MERYSRLCQISGSGADASCRELGRSSNLNQFLHQMGISNLQAVFDAVSRTLAGFRTLSNSDALPERPMLIRFCPMELSGRPGWSGDVRPFLALCGSGADSTGALYQHTCFFSYDLLLNDDDFTYLDHLFGTRFAAPDRFNAQALDQAPDRVSPDLRGEDALLVQLCAAALLTGWPIVLKLEKDCVFNRRAMDLLSQIYSLLPPNLAARTGFSSYQDPQQLEAILGETPIRIFLIHADCTCSSTDPQFLFLDLDQPLNPQIVDQQTKGFSVSKKLFTYIQYWHSLPWRERQPLMKLLFSEAESLPNEQSYCSITHNFVQDPFIRWINRMPDRGAISSLQQLTEKYSSFPICEQIPILREKFCAAVPELLTPPLTLDDLAKDLFVRLTYTREGTEDHRHLQDLLVFLRSIQAVCGHSSTRNPQPSQAELDQAAAMILALREEHANQIRAMEQEFEAKRIDMEHSFSCKIRQLDEQNHALRNAHVQQLEMLKKDHKEEIHLLLCEAADRENALENKHAQQLEMLKKEHETEIGQMYRESIEREAELDQLRLEADARAEALERKHAEQLKMLECQYCADRDCMQHDLHELEHRHKEEREQLRLYAAEGVKKLKQKHAEELAEKNAIIDKLRSEIRDCSALHEAKVKDVVHRLHQERQKLQFEADARAEALERKHAEELDEKNAMIDMLRSEIRKRSALHEAKFEEAEHRLRQECQMLQRELDMQNGTISQLRKQIDRLSHSGSPLCDNADETGSDPNTSFSPPEKKRTFFRSNRQHD